MSDTESKTLGMRLAKCIFYFDLDNSGYLPKLTKYVTMAGAVLCIYLIIVSNALRFWIVMLRTLSPTRQPPLPRTMEEFATIMLGCLDSRTGHQSALSKGKTNASVGVASPTLHRYASVTRKRNLSQYLEDEKRNNGKGKTSNSTTTTTTHVVKRGITPIYAVAANVSGMVLPATSSNEPEKDPKKPYFKPFEHPFVLIDDAALMHAPIWKEFGAEALKTSKSGEPWPVLHWKCPVGYCPFVQPPTTTKSPSPHTAKATAKGVNTRSRAAIEHPSKLPIKASSTKLAADQPTAAHQTVQRPKSKRMTAMNANRSRPGYCECCYERYSDLAKHVSSLFHRQFALEDKNYAELDKLLSQIHREPITSNECNMDNKIAVDRQTILLRSPVSQKSTISDCNGSIGRNYMANKRAKQCQTLKEFRPCDLRENFDNENSKENNNIDYPTSPSCKRRRSARSLIMATRLEQ